MANNQKYGVLSMAMIGIEFEFFSSLSAKSIITMFKNRLGVKVVGGYKERSFDKDKLGYHTGFKPTDRVFKLERDFSGGPDMYELITGPMPYFEAKKIIIETLKTIKEIGWTNDKASLHLNISFIDNNIRVFDINIFKFCLGFKDIEDSVLADFPSRKNNIYAESITRLAPNFNYKMVDIENLSLDKIIYLHPLQSRYFGVNFTKRKDNYLEFRYLGGKGYEKKSDKVLEYLDKFIFYMYENATNQEIDQITADKYLSVLSKKLKKVDGLKDYDMFKHRFPNIDLTIDLKPHASLVNLKFHEFRDRLYELIFLNDMKSGLINYDSDVSVLQVKDAKLNRVKDIQGMEFVLCEISGMLSNCGFYNCDLTNATLSECSINGGSTVVNSKIYECKIGNAVEIEDTFIKNTKHLINGDIKGCIIASSESLLGPTAEVDEETLFASADIGFKKVK